MCNSLSDHELMEAMACEDRDAFNELMERHLTVMVSVAQRILGNAAEADEIAQEAFIKLWLYAEKWDPNGQAVVKTWLSRVVTNLCLDCCRRRRSVPLDDMEEIVDPADTIFDQMKQRDRFKVINMLLQGVPDRQRAAVVHFYFEDMSGQEVAEIMGITEGAVESLLVRARRHLRTQAQRQGIVWGEDL